MTEEEIAYTVKCIKENIHNFYNWSRWKRKRIEVLELDRFECQECKRKGRYTRATTVHHVIHVKQNPLLALCIYYMDKGIKKRNLISLCHDCHEKIHERGKYEIKKLITEEKW